MKAARARVTLALALVCVVGACRQDDDFPTSPREPFPPAVTANVTTTDTLQPIADAHIRSFAPNTNYGAADSLTVRSFTGSSSRFSVYIKFDQAVIAAHVGTAQLDSAKLEFFLRDGGSWPAGGASIDAYRIPNSWAPNGWTEGGITSNCPNDTNTSNSQLNCPGGVWDTTGFAAMSPTGQVLLTNATRNWISFDVTADVNAWLSGSANQGWYIAKHDVNNGRIVFWSREGTYKPHLVLYTTQAEEELPPVADLITWPSGDLPVVTATNDTLTDYYRTIYAVGFNGSTPDQTILDFMDKFHATIIGGMGNWTELPMYVIQVPDPGSSFAALQALADSMRHETSVAAVLEMAAGGRRDRGDQRYPVDTELASTRAAWFDTQNSQVRPWLAIRAPQAWGCETGTYGSTPVNVGVFDLSFDTVASDLNLSTPGVFYPPDSLYETLPGGRQLMDSWKSHGNEVSTVLTAAGDNNTGIAGTIWKTNLSLFTTRRGYYYGKNPTATALLMFQRAIAHDVNILSMSVVLGSAMNSNDIAEYGRAIRAYLNSGPRRMLVVSTGNEHLTKSLSEVAKVMS